VSFSLKILSFSAQIKPTRYLPSVTPPLPFPWHVEPDLEGAGIASALEAMFGVK
jgi:hypothetical protein